ncbi:hypothetical protein [Streptacidiphilus sp. EB129]|uniref:hypothetical protein n=1 Tax=Streptacidiphilus sp. EB129 TaxID=3156262 RepID=UPI00351909B3
MSSGTGTDGEAAGSADGAGPDPAGPEAAGSDPDGPEAAGSEPEAAETAEASRERWYPVGQLASEVRIGAAVTLLALIAAVVMLFLPVSPSLPPGLASSIDPPQSYSCGSVLMPSDFDVLGTEWRQGPSLHAESCASARIAQGGWSGLVGIGGLFALVFALLLADGSVRPPAPQGSAASPSPSPSASASASA